jgi:hypothetical protein
VAAPAPPLLSFSLRRREGEKMVRKYLGPYRVALLIACGLYLAACALPATEWWKTPDGYLNDDPLKGEHYVTASGWECLTLGWMFVPAAVEVGSFGMVAWLANPLALVGVVLLIFRLPTGATAFGVMSFVIGTVYVIDPPDRPDRPGHSDVPQVGALLWLGSLLALAIAAMIRRGRSLARKHDAEQRDAADGGA